MPRSPMPGRVRPMLAKLVDEPFDRPGWLFEVKWDGYRAIAHIKGGKATLTSRNGINFTKRYAPIAEALAKIKHSCVLDGEIIALKRGKSDFHTLQEYAEHPAPLRYAVFDLLWLDGRDLRKTALKERKRLLKGILPRSTHILYSKHVERYGKKFFTLMFHKRTEGMVAKDGASRYEAGKRSGAWQKVKTRMEQEAIIVGFTKPRRSRKYLGSLVLAAHDHGKLCYVGHSGGGFTEGELKALHAKLEKIAVKKSPIRGTVPIKEPVTWVSPRYVCEMSFTEWTADNRMRHPVYQGLRADKKPRGVIIERG